MFLRIFTIATLSLTLFGGAVGVNAQTEELPDASSRSGRPRRDEPPYGFREMLAKQRAEREKKEYQEMLDRGEEALRLTKQLETSYAQNGGFSNDDRARLESLERTVTKIRKELGAEDDDVPAKDPSAARAEEPKPSTMEEAFTYLKSTTIKLVDELKKTSRFSISVVAIQSSNTIIKLVRFLRFRK